MFHVITVLVLVLKNICKIEIFLNKRVEEEKDCVYMCAQVFAHISTKIWQCVFVNMSFSHFV